VDAWSWFGMLPLDSRLIFSRYTQIGLLRILTNQAAMGATDVDHKEGLGVYERWLEDPRVQFYSEPRGLDFAFRQATEPFAAKPASKWVGDCYLLAYAKESDAVLVTFDKALLEVARKHGYAAVAPA